MFWSHIFISSLVMASKAPKGSSIKRRGGSWIKVYKGAQEIKYPQITGEQQTPNDNFIDAILGRAEPRTSAENGIIQSQLMDAIYESARTGQPASPA